MRPLARDEEVQRIYRELSDGSLDLSAPSVPPLMAQRDDDEPITEQFELPVAEAPRAVNRDRGVLVRVDGPSSGQVFSIDGAELVLGRGQNAGLRVQEEGISRRHALLIRTRGHYFVQDLESSNGTFLEGRRVKRAPLMEGDLIQLGPHASFRFCMMDQKQERAMMRLYEESTVDALTRVHNRRFLDKRFDEELAYALRHGTELSVALFDIDYFKHVNDRHGRVSGDLILRRIAEVIADQLRIEDVVARYSGAQFLVLLRGVPQNGAKALAERVRRTVQNTQLGIGRIKLRVTLSGACASLGGCAAPAPGGAAPAPGGAAPGGASPSQAKDELLAQIDERLRRAKHDGRNQICWD